MLFSIGTKVRLVHTGDQGTVLAHLPNDMIMVRLNDGFEIPVFEEDITHTEDFFSDKEYAKATDIQKKEVVVPSQQATRSDSNESSQNRGLIFLAFDPVLRKDGSTDRFKILLINTSGFDVLYDFTLTILGRKPAKSDGILKPGGILQVAEMSFDHLNDAPEINCELIQLTTAGQGDTQRKQLKIRAKQFFSKIDKAPLLLRPAHVYTLIEKFIEAEIEKIPKEDLQTYTQRKAVPQKTQKDTPYRRYHLHDIREFAEFKPELDLHLEKLSDQPEKLSTAEAIRLQLRLFDRFMADAIRLGVPRVFIIHGVGKGRLRDEIATRLLRMPEVRTFKNEFHPRYGWGATEVEL